MTYRSLFAKTTAAMLCVLFAGISFGQSTKYWVGGSGSWSDAAHWAISPNGPGGAGQPRNNEHAILRSGTAITVAMDAQAWCQDLIMNGPVAVQGGSEVILHISGNWSTDANVTWLWNGIVELDPGPRGVELDLGRTELHGTVRFSGKGSWSMLSDLRLADEAELQLNQGTVVSNGNMVRAGSFKVEGSKAKRVLFSGSAVVIERALEAEAMRLLKGSGASHLAVAGVLVELDATQMARGITACGTGAGQTPFTIDAQLLSNYNGFGVSCKGSCNGVVTVVRNGGVGPTFTYQWLFGGPQAQTWSSSCAGTQVVIVTDNGQGVSCSATIQVTDPGALGVIFFPAIVPPACADVCDGQANVIAVGGTGVYQFDWNNGAGSGSSFNGLCAGVNTLEVMDNNNCVFDTTFTINLQPITVALTTTDVGCFGDCDGTATVNASGGTGTLTYTWSPPPTNGQNVTTAEGFCAGPGSVIIQDQNGCDTTINFLIAEPPPLETFPSSTDATCGDVCDGTASVSPVGQPGQFSFFWDPPLPDGTATADATDLCAGTWTVLVTDLNSGCDTLITFIIDAPTLIDPQLTITDATCSDVCDGEVDPDPQGGTGAFTYFWDPVPFNGQGVPVATGLCPGPGTVLITDALGCDTLVSFTIGSPPPLDVILTTTDVTCAGECDGTVTLVISGGTPAYDILWTPAPGGGQGTTNATGLCAGPGVVTVTDMNGCDTTIQFVIAEPPSLELTATQTDVTCGSNCDGSISVVVTGGSPNYDYLWAPEPGTGQGTPTVTGLCPGPYTLVVTDDNDCELLTAFEILAPVPLLPVLTATDASCPGVCDGEASVLVNGGIPPYTYFWSPPPGQGQGSTNATQLCPGTYTLLISDSVGCDTTLLFIIDAFPQIIPNEIVTPPNCANSCDGSIILAPTGGDGTFTYSWTPVPSNGDFTPEALQLCGGTYTVTIGSGGCDTTLTIELTAPPALDVQLSATDATCADACDGTVTAIVSGGTPNYDLLWDPPPAQGQGTLNATGFCPGPVQLTVTDLLGCDTTVTIQVGAPPPYDILLVLTEAGCGGACDGTASATVQGSNGGYTYDWQPPPGSGQGTANATQMCPGAYVLTVSDSLGCDTMISFVIATASGISAIPTVGDASCSDVCDGTIDLAVSGGVPPYTYTWNPPPPVGDGTGNVAGLCPGSYSVVVGDQAGCDTLLVIDVGSPPPLVPLLTITNETCNGPCDGTATLDISGGQPGYVITWTPPPGAGQGSQNATGLCAGEYAVTIVDAGGCDTTLVFEILPEQPFDVEFTKQDITCFGDCDGWATVDVTGGIGPYDYLWTPSPGMGQGTDSAYAMCGDAYQLLITDAVGCDTLIDFIIVKPPAIGGSLITSDENCFGPCTGEASFTATGGSGTYTYDWQPPPGTGQGTNAVSGLCANVNYTIQVTDSLGCDTTFAFTIFPFQPILGNLSTTPVSCPGACDGTATVGPTGGEPPYSYVWSPEPGGGQNSEQATDLCEGVYMVTITDDNDCDTTIAVLITGPLPISPNATIDPISCAGECDGSIVLNTTGGNGGFTYDWDPAPPNGDGSNAAFDLCPGTWNVTIADVNGCDTTVSFTLTEPPPLVLGVASTQSECQVCNGTATASVSGGTPQYTFIWTDQNNMQVGADSVLTGLCAGIYTVLVTDANGCTATAAASISDQDGEVLQTTDGITSCPNTCDGTVSVQFVCSDPPCTVAWTTSLGVLIGQNTETAIGLCAGTYLVQVTNNTGCVTIASAVVNSPDPIVPNLSTTLVSCPGACDAVATVGPTGGVGPFTYAWNPVPQNGDGTPQAVGLCEGSYQVNITDLGTGCDTLVNVLIIGPTPILPNATVQAASCSGICDASIVLSPSGGNGGYQYNWTPPPPNGNTGNGAFGLCPGIWNVTISDLNGCDTTVSFTIVDPQPIVLSGASTTSQCQVCDGTATVSIAGGVPPYAVQWVDDNGLPVGTDPSLQNLCAGIYVVSVTDSTGCMASLMVPVEDSDGEALSTIDGQTTCASSCNGQVEAVVSCVNGPCVITWYDDQGVLIAQATNVVSGLCPGDYFVQVVNSLGCISVDTATVVPGSTLVPNLSSTPVTCSGACDGTATIAPSGGVGPYAFSWTPPPAIGDSTGQVGGLCAGVYQVEVTDLGTDCDTVYSVLIIEPSPFVVNASVQPVLCASECTGSIVVSPQGGTAPYQYAWDPIPQNGDGSNGAFGLCAGNWSVTVTDPLGCDTTLTYTITEPPPLELSGSSTQSECNLCIGTASVSVLGGTGAYIYSWTLNGLPVGNDSLLTDLCAGIYVVTVQDVNGCIAMLVVPVTDVDGEETTTADGVTTCPGDCDGTVSVSFTCSDPLCTIAWFDAMGLSLNTDQDVVDSLCAGTYFVQVTNGSGCITIDTAFVTEPDPILANLSTTPVTCAGDCDGTATVGPTGGIAPYTFAWTPVPANGDSTNQALGLCAGTYSVTITDSVGCSVVQGVFITEPQPLSASANIEGITCTGACDGSIVVQVTGGNGGYQFDWTPTPSNGDSTNAAFNLCADTYVLLITDSLGCDTTYTFILTDPPLLEATIATVDNLCFGDCEGIATATVNGGIPPYAIMWTDAGGTTIAMDSLQLSGLCAGEYFFNVTDSSGCMLQLPFTVGEGPAIEANLLFTNETCNGPCDGTASVSPSGGAGGTFTIFWQPEPGVGQGTTQVGDLCPGNWQVTLTDTLGCDTTYAFTILPYVPLDDGAVVTPITCNGACDGSIVLQPTGGSGGYNYTWDPEPPNGPGNSEATDLCPGTWTVIIADDIGCDTLLTFTLTEPDELVVQLDSVTNASCSNATDGAIAITIGGGVPGYSILWTGPGFTSIQEDITGLMPGSYTVEVTDSNSCVTALVVEVAALVSVVADAGADAQVCTGTVVVLDGSGSIGGVDFDWTNSNNDPLGTGVILDLGVVPPGNYTFTLTVSDGVCSDVDEVIIEVLDLPIAEAGPNQTIFISGSAQIGGSPTGPAGSTYIWSPDSLLDDASASNPQSTPTQSTWFFVTVVAPNGCTATDSVFVTVVPEIVIPTGFSPNDDGRNDVWQIDLIELFPNVEVEIYSRWGELLFQSVGYRVPWDGRYNGGVVPVGTYYYVIRLNDPEYPDAYTGPLTVIR